MMRWPFLLLLLGLTTAACSHIDADHPFDPESPTSAQHRARLSGRLIGVGDAARPDTEVRLALTTDAADATPRYAVGVDAQGQFRFDAVLAGTYHLTATGPGVDLAARVIDLAPARVVDLGDISLSGGGAGAATGQRIAGIVRLADRPDRSAGVVIRSSEGAVALTAADGLFRIQLFEGDRPILIADYPGYTQGVLNIPSDAEPVDGEVRLTTPVLLAPAAGRVVGAAQLWQFDSDDRRQSVDVRLVPAEGDPLVAELGGDGSFALDDVPAGPWTLRATRQGYDPIERPVTLEAAETVDVGALRLTHASSGPDAVPLGGRVHDQDDTPLVGTPVTVRFSVGNDVFAVVYTDAEGRFEVPAAADDGYRLFTGPGDSTSFGPVAWDPEAEVWTNLGGDPVDLTVLRNQ